MIRRRSRPCSSTCSWTPAAGCRRISHSTWTPRTTRSTAARRAGSARGFHASLHGYYDCYCYLPLYVFCGAHLLAVKLRRANIDASAGAAEEIARIVARIRVRWPKVRILLRADGGFARDTLMALRSPRDRVLRTRRRKRLVQVQPRRLCLRAGAHQAAGRPAGFAGHSHRRTPAMDRGGCVDQGNFGSTRHLSAGANRAAWARLHDVQVPHDAQ